MMPKVSVIVPIYNASAYIKQCAVSLFEQTLDDIEYIFIDDCTTDDSMEVLNECIEEYPNRKNRIKILKHAVNSGQAAARTTGMKAATGEYMIHCDPDDWVDQRMYSDMYYEAIKANADIAVCGIEWTNCRERERERI